MPVTARTIASNTIVYTGALTMQKVLSFVYFSYLARTLGTDLTGKYFFALSLAAIAMVFMDIGLTYVVTREAAKDTSKTKLLVSQVTTLKIFFTACVAIILFTIAPIAITDTVVRHLVYIAFAIAMFDSFSLAFFGAIRAQQNLIYESISSIIFQVITLTFGSIAISQGADIRIVMLALFTASLINMLISLSVLRIKFDIVPQLRISWSAAKKILLIALPFALATVFVKTQAYIDTVLLKFMLGDAQVGIYSVAYKITFAFQFIPLAFIAALYPAFSQYWQHDRSQLKVTFLRSYEYLLMIALPITLGVTAVAYDVIPFIYTESYSGSILPLVVLLASLPFLFVNFPVGSLLNACSRQTRQMVHLGITTAISIALNVILIPKFGPLGAAMASTLSTIVIFALGMWVVRSLLDVTFSVLLWRLIRTFFVGGVMFIAVVAVNWYAPWIIAIAVGAIVYPLLLFALKLLTAEDIRMLRSLVKR